MATVFSTGPDALVVLEGEIDLYSYPQVKAQLDPLLEHQVRRIILDLSGVSYVDSSGLALFIETHQRAEGYGGAVVICSPSAGVSGIFEIARMEQILEIFPTRQAAVGAAGR